MNTELLKLAYEVLKKCKEDSRYEGRLVLGTGCERIAYKLNDDYVLKIAKHAFIEATEDEDDRYGLDDDRYDYCEEWQTEREIEIWEKMSTEEQSLFNPIVASGKFEGYPFIVSPYVEIEGYGRDSAMVYCKQNELRFDFELLTRVAKKFTLDFYDMTENSSNFGLTKDGKLVVTDFGLTEI